MWKLVARLCKRDMNLRTIEERTRAWMNRNADAPLTQVALGFISFFEASVLPLPPSSFMITMIALGKRNKWIYLATLTTIMSVLGGLFGYLVGGALYDTVGMWVIERYNLAETIAQVGVSFADNAFLAVFVGAFTPIPYRALTLGGGFFSLDLGVFIGASLVGRGLRFFILAYLAELFGEQVTKHVFKFITLSTLVAISATVVLVVWKSF